MPGHHIDTLTSATSAKASAAPSCHATHTHTAHCEEVVQPGAALVTMPMPQSGSMATDHQQAAAPTHFRVSSQASNASAAQAQLPDPTTRLQPAPPRSTLYHLRNHNLSRALPPGLSSMHAASLDSQQTAAGAVTAADHTDEVLPSCYDAAAKNKHAMATPTGFDQALSNGPSTSDHPLHDHPLHDQQGSDSCSSDEDVAFGSPILQAPQPMPPCKTSTRTTSPPPGFENVTHNHLFDEHESDSTSGDDSATQTLSVQSRVQRRAAASAVAPPPGFEDVIPQPGLSQGREGAAGSSQTVTNAEAGSDHAGCACDRWPRPDGSHRHITEKGKRRQKRRALLRKQARQAQRSQL